MSLSKGTNFRRQPIKAFGQIVLNSIIQLLKNFWALILFIFIKSDGQRDSNDNLIYLIVPVFIAIKSILDYLFFRFKITEEEIQVKSGIFSRKQVTLAMHKVQSVHINQSWIQKFLNISELSFDSPGSSEPEITIQLSQKEANEIMAFVLDNKQNESKDEELIEDELISELSFKDLFKLGITSNHLETLFILIALGFSLINNIKDFFDDFESLMEESTNKFLQSSFVLIAISILAILAIAILVSLVRTIVAYINSKITKNIQGFKVSKGFINRSQKLLPFNKVQYISWKTNWLQKKISMYVFEFHTIGAVEIKDNFKIKTPITSEKTLNKLANSYLPNIPEQFENSLRMHSSFWLRNFFFIGILPVLIFGIPLFLMLTDKSMLLLFSLPPVYFGLYYFSYYKKFLFSWNKDMLNIKTGAFGKEIIVLKWEKIQSVKISQNLFQQRKSLANLTIHTAGGTIIVPFIPLNAAQSLQNIALFKVETSLMKWH
jgi:putative membrane protein